jgi:hypothetical protein
MADEAAVKHESKMPRGGPRKRPTPPPRVKIEDEGVEAAAATKGFVTGRKKKNSISALQRSRPAFVHSGPVDAPVTKVELGEPALAPVPVIPQAEFVRMMMAPPPTEPGSEWIIDSDKSSSSSSSVPRRPVSQEHSRIMLAGEFGILPIDDKEDPTKKPPTSFNVQAALDRLNRPVLIGGGLMSGIPEEKLKALIMIGEASLPISTAAHESRLLGAAGEWMHTFAGRTVSYNFPACTNGSRCIGNYPARNRIRVKECDFVDAPCVTLMSWMPEDTYTAFLSSGGTAPVVSRRCILCARNETLGIVTATPGRGMGQEVAPTDIIHVYTNLVDEPGGYVHDCVIQRDASRGHTGLIAPMAMMVSSKLQWYKGANGRPMINQQRMIWGKPESLEPERGEPLH